MTEPASVGHKIKMFYFSCLFFNKIITVVCTRAQFFFFSSRFCLIFLHLAIIYKVDTFAAFIKLTLFIALREKNYVIMSYDEDELLRFDLYGVPCQTVCASSAKRATAKKTSARELFGLLLTPHNHDPDLFFFFCSSLVFES